MELVINFSGGKDSCAMLAYLCEKYPDIKKHVVFADTGWEHAGAEEWCRSIVEKFKLTLNVVRNPNKDFFKMVLHRGKFPSSGQRQCTSDLKRGPIQTWIRQNLKGNLIVSCMGLRAEESPSRAKKKRLSRNKSLTNKKRTVWDWLPIQDWDKNKVISYLDNKGIPLHPVYNYLDRFSCQVCIFMSPKDLLAVKENNPAAIKRISGIERQIGFSMRSDGYIDLVIERQKEKINRKFNYAYPFFSG